MPGLITEHSSQSLEIKELHPTFGAEITGLNLKECTDDQFQELLAAMAKVRPSLTRLWKARLTLLPVRRMRGQTIRTRRRIARRLLTKVWRPR